MVRFMRLVVSLRFIACLGLACTGCGSGLELAPVSGRVTMNGQPVTQGEITFVPHDGPPAMGTISADGTFQLTTLEAGDGAVLGQHQVTIMATKVGSGSLAPTSFEQELQGAQAGGKMLIPGTVTWLVPEKYSRLQTSDLTAEVKSGTNAIDFDLKD